MASLKVWNGDMVEIDKLTEVWVQIRGILPKWCDRITIREIASCLGKLAEVDWQSLFTCSFSMIRVKLKCKNPKKILSQRVMEMGDKLYLINFLAEGVEQEQSVGKCEDGDKDEDPNGKGDEGLEEDGLPGEDLDDGGSGGTPHSQQTANEGDKKQPSDYGGGSSGSKSGTKNVGRLSSLLLQNVKLGFYDSNMPECYDLLSAMELEDCEGEDTEDASLEITDQEEMLPLPTDWVYTLDHGTDSESANKVQEHLGDEQDETERCQEGEILLGDD